MSVLRYAPVMWLPILVYSVIGLLDGSGAAAALAREAFSMPMPSGDTWTISYENLMVAFALTCLSVELVRTGRATNQSIISTLLVSLGFIFGLMLMLLVKGFATSAFFFILLMTLASFLLSATILVFNAQRSVGLGPGLLHGHGHAE